MQMKTFPIFTWDNGKHHLWCHNWIGDLDAITRAMVHYNEDSLGKAVKFLKLRSKHE